MSYDDPDSIVGDRRGSLEAWVDLEHGECSPRRLGSAMRWPPATRSGRGPSFLALCDNSPCRGLLGEQWNGSRAPDPQRWGWRRNLARPSWITNGRGSITAVSPRSSMTARA